MSGSTSDGSAAYGVSTSDGSAAFEAHRNLLFTVAYEMLGSAADAEDVVQETWLRWNDRVNKRRVDEEDGVNKRRVDEEVRDPRAYLVRIVTRQALNRLRTLQRTRETYVGPWLPEPLLTTPDVAHDVELAESVSMAMLLVLDSLNPTERAVFVLREVFGFEYAEIAASVDKSEAAVRQVLSRARKHVQARRPRVRAQAEHEAVVERFLEAAAGGDVQKLMDVLAPDVVMLSDGGGVKQAALRPIVGRDKVMRWLAGVMSKNLGEITMDIATVNGEPAVRIWVDGQIDVVAAVRVDGDRVSELYFVRNPAKLTRLSGEGASLSR
jgi:RNA polymerase sigma-70 factor (TIGR02957 family)